MKNWNLVFNVWLVFICLVIFAHKSICQISMTSTGSNTQNFDVLSNTGSGNSWANNSTIPNWYASRSTYDASTGSGTAGAIYSYGVAGTNPSTDRALGSINSNSTNDISYGVQLQNNSSQTITSMNVDYTGEQWRREQPTSNNELLGFYYKVSTSAITTIDASTSGWTSVGSLIFNGLQYGSGTAIDGNASANRTTFSSVSIPSLSIPVGSYIVFKWIDFNVGGTDIGLSIDDVTLSWTVSAGGPTNYYSNSTGPLNTLSNWGTNTDGTGTAPTNFTTANQVFNIRNNATPTINAAWTVSGSGSKIVVGDGSSACNFTIPSGAPVTGTIDVSANSTLTIQNSTNPTFGTISTTSTVDFARAGAQTVPATNYGNLTISGNKSGAVTLASGIVAVAGTFSVTATGVSSWTNTGNTVDFSSSSSQNIPAIDYLNITNTGNGARVLSSSGTIKIAGAFSTGSGTYTVTGSTVDFNGSGSITIPVPISGGTNYNNLTCSGSSGTKTFGGGCSIGGTFTISGNNTVLLNNTSSVRTFNIVNFTMSSGVLDSGSSDVTPSGPTTIVNFTGTFDKSGGTTNNSSPTQVGRFVFNSGGLQLFSLNAATTNAYRFISTYVQSNTSLVLFSNFVSTGVTGTWLTVEANSSIEAGDYQLSTTVTSTTPAINGTIKTTNTNGFSGSTLTTFKSTNSPTISLGSSSTIEYNGSSSQTITARTDYANVTINNSAGCALGGNTTISNTLDFTNGKLTLGSFSLTLNGSVNGPSFGSSSSNYIVAEGAGVLKRNAGSNVLFPIGTASEYLPCQLSGGSGTYFVNLISPPTTGLPTNETLTQQWNITNGGTGPTMSFQWPSGVEGSGFSSSSNIKLYRFDGTWASVGTIATPSGSPRTATFPSVPCCSGYTIGTEAALPVELISFKAILSGNSTLLTWQTATEVNNSHFSIEKSTDGKNFKEIGTVEGNGTSYTINDYNFTDESPVNGLNYYRLKQVDFNGNFEYSKIVSVTFGGLKGLVQIYPTNAAASVTIHFSSPSEEAGTIQVYDYNGKLVKVQSFEDEVEDSILQIAELPSGPYIVKVQTGKILESLRFIRI